MRRAISLLPVLLSCLVALAACGSSAGRPAQPAATDLGVFASTQPTLVTMSFVNPLAVEASVVEAASSGAFAVEPGGLPGPVAAGAEHEVQVRFTPVGTSLVTGSISLLYAGAGQSITQTHLFQARGERVVWELGASPVDFGTVAVDAVVERLVTFRNASSLSPVPLSDNVQAPSAAWSIVDSPFPMTVAPGEQRSFTLRCAPTAPASHSGTVRISATTGSGALEVPVLAVTPGEGSETIVDFGLQFLTGGLTAQLSVDVPADAVSLTVEGHDANGATTLGLGELIGPGDKVYENLALTGDYVWNEGAEVFATTIPNTDRTNVQLVPGGGTYRFRIRRLGGFANQVRVRAIIERRSAGSESAGTLDLNVWLADGITPRAATAANDARLQTILARIDAILAVRGVRLGDVDYYDVIDPAFDEVRSDGEFGQLLKTTSVASAVRLNLFFVEVALGGRVVGAAATISGPKRNGTSLSGVMSIYEGGLSANVVGMIAAHELGHFLGLNHTVEQDGSHDLIDDTADCPASGTNLVCPTAGGGYLMHWQALGGTAISAGQGRVLRAHPLMSPGTPGLLKFDPAPVDLVDLAQAASLPEGWCACCARRAKPAPAPGR